MWEELSTAILVAPPWWGVWGVGCVGCVGCVGVCVWEEVVFGCGGEASWAGTASALRREVVEVVLVVVLVAIAQIEWVKHVPIIYARRSVTILLLSSANNDKS